MKTPEELAEEYAFNIYQERYESLDSEERHVYAEAIDAFLVGYQAAAPQWISVKDRLPKDGTSVLVTRGGPGCTTATYFEKSGFYNGHLEDVVITHWMPLPKPPEE